MVDGGDWRRVRAESSLPFGSTVSGDIPDFSTRYLGVAKLIAFWDLAMQPPQTQGRLMQ